MKVAFLALFLTIFVGCTAPPAAEPAASTATPSTAPVQITSTTTAEIESAIAERLRALGAKDLTAFQATVDLTRPAFRRCQQETFDVAARQGFGAGPTKVVKVEPYGNGYVRAYLDDVGHGIERVYFRRNNDRWVLTEPKADELGGERSKVVDGVRVEYWGADEDIAELVGRESAATREFLMPYANGPIRDPYFVKLIPTRETAGIVACGFIGFSNGRDLHAPFIGLWRVWLAPSLDRVSDFQQAVLRHEGLHYLQDQFIHFITMRLDWWLVEGWPDFIAKSRSRGEIVRAACGTPVALKRIIDGIPTEPDTPPEVVSPFYAQANSMIEYVYATYGPQAYWDLVALYKDNVDYRVNYPKIFGVEPDVFYQRWQAFAKKKYC